MGYVDGVYKLLQVPPTGQVNLSPGKMLRGKLQKFSVHVADPGVGLHGPGGGECPAAAAHALVPHGVDDALLPPVHRGGQILQPNVRPGEIGPGHHGSAETTRVGGDKFLSKNWFTWSCYCKIVYFERSANLVTPIRQL